MTSCKENLVRKMLLLEQDEEIDNSPNFEVIEAPGTAGSAANDDIWANFTKKVATQRPSESASAILEMRQY